MSGCGGNGPPRRHEIGAVPILSRFGLERPDERPLPFGEHVGPEVTLGDYRTAAPGWGRTLQVFAFVGQNGLATGQVAIDPPEEGAWITAWAATSSPGFLAVRVFTTNQTPEPAIGAAGSSSIVARFDNREPAPTIAIRTGRTAAPPGTAGEILTSAVLKPIWWYGTTLVFNATAVTDDLFVNLLLELPFQGAKRAV